MIASLLKLLLKDPRKPERILFFKLATVVVAVERSAARQSCGGAHLAAATHASTLIGVCVCVCVCVKLQTCPRKCVMLGSLKVSVIIFPPGMASPLLEL